MTSMTVKPVAARIPGDAGAVGASALAADPVDVPVRVEELDALRIPATGRRELAIRDRTSEVVDDRDVMSVLVSIDPRHQQTR